MVIYEVQLRLIVAAKVAPINQHDSNFTLDLLKQGMANAGEEVLQVLLVDVGSWMAKPCGPSNTPISSTSLCPVRLRCTAPLTPGLLARQKQPSNTCFGPNVPVKGKNRLAKCGCTGSKV